jgi:hypothetical protein
MPVEDRTHESDAGGLQTLLVPSLPGKWHERNGPDRLLTKTLVL